MPAEAQKLMEELMSAIEVDEYLDLKDPSLSADGERHAARRRAGRYRLR